MHCVPRRLFSLLHCWTVFPFALVYKLHLYWHLALRFYTPFLHVSMYKPLCFCDFPQWFHCFRTNATVHSKCPATTKSPFLYEGHIALPNKHCLGTCIALFLAYHCH